MGQGRKAHRQAGAKRIVTVDSRKCTDSRFQASTCRCAGLAFGGCLLHMPDVPHSRTTGAGNAESSSSPTSSYDLLLLQTVLGHWLIQTGMYSPPGNSPFRCEGGWKSGKIFALHSRVNVSTRHSEWCSASMVRRTEIHPTHAPECRFTHQ